MVGNWRPAPGSISAATRYIPRNPYSVVKSPRGDRSHSIPPRRSQRLIAQEHAAGSEAVLPSYLKTPENHYVAENHALGKHNEFLDRGICFIGKKHTRRSTKLPNSPSSEKSPGTSQLKPSSRTRVRYMLKRSLHSVPNKVVDPLESSGSKSLSRCLVKCSTERIRRFGRLVSMADPMFNAVIDAKSECGLSSEQSHRTAQSRSRKRRMSPCVGEGFLGTIYEDVDPLGNSRSKSASRCLVKCSTERVRRSARLASMDSVSISKDPAQGIVKLNHRKSCNGGSRNLLHITEGQTTSINLNALTPMVAPPKVLEDAPSTEVSSKPICVAHQENRFLGMTQASCLSKLPDGRRKGFPPSIPKVADLVESSGFMSPEKCLVKCPTKIKRRSARLASRDSDPMVEDPTHETWNLKHSDSCDGGSGNLRHITETQIVSRDFNVITPIVAPPKVLEDVRSSEVTSKPIRLYFRGSKRKPSNLPSGRPGKASKAEIVQGAGTREVDTTTKHSFGGSYVSMPKERLDRVALTSKELLETKRGTIEDSWKKGSSIQTGETAEELILPEWTKEQKEALQRAFLIAKPSPHFWKKVSKMVPGKSAQECFNRIHADLSTPLQPQPRPKNNRMNFSPIGSMSLAESNSSMLATRRPTSGKQKILVAHKTVRHLLRKHQLIDQNKEADFFSDFEPSPLKADFSSIFEPSPFKASLDFPETGMYPSDECIPDHHNATSSAIHNKMLTRLNTTRESNFHSPEVLKQLKNIALHEKYIDQLHRREAHRKASSKTASSTAIVARGNDSTFKTPVIKAAKNALLCEANDLIHEFRKEQVNFMVDDESLDSDEKAYSDDEDNDE